MKIAQVAPLYESIPPRYYGTTERVISYLTEELVKKDHDVTLFASGDSITSASLVPVVRSALCLSETTDRLASHFRLLEEVTRRAHDFDVIHYHADYLHYPLSRQLHASQLTTLHGCLDTPGLNDLYREYNDMPVVPVSYRQRSSLPSAYWLPTVYNGVPPENYTFKPDDGSYLAFLGRISPQEGIEPAIEIAMRSGLPLKVAAKVDAVDRDYFIAKIKPLFAHPLIEFIGDVGETEKENFIGNACALLLTADRPEPYSLVNIEAMACGTPAIGFRRGPVMEIITHGKTGFIVNDIDDAVDAVENITMLSRHCCRRIFESRFSAQRMAQDYLNIYNSLLGEPPRLRLVK